MHADQETYSSSIDELADREAREWESKHAQPVLSLVEVDSETRPPALVDVPLDGFMEEQPSLPSYAIAGLVPISHVTLVGGHGGTGKTTFSLVACAHVACGQAWAGRTVRGPGRAVFVSLEDEAKLVRGRLRRIVDEYGLNPDTVARNVRILDGSGTDGALMIESGRRLVPTSIMGEVEAAAVGATLVVIDNASDAFAGDEINRRHVRTFMSHLARLARQNDAAVLLLAHIDKNAARNGGNGNSYSGSTAWHNSARSRLALVDSDGSLVLQQEKLNLGRMSDPISLRFTDSGVIVPWSATSEEVKADADERAKGDSELLIDLLTIAERAGISVPTATSGPATALHALDPLPEFPARFRTKDGKRHFASALVRLGRAGAIVKKTYKTPARHLRERWELAQDWRISFPEESEKCAR